MKDYQLRQITRYDYLRGLEDELWQTDVQAAVETRLDQINELTASLNYQGHRAVQCLLAEILDIVRLNQGTLSASDASTTESVRVISAR